MRFFEERLEHTPILPKEVPLEVFHYTTVEGLHGILTSGKLWATDVRYLNDKSEFIYAQDLVREVAASLKTGLEPVFDLPGALSTNFLNVFDCYVSCFCEDGDLLSQWRAYSLQGAGYAIGFNLPRLRALCSKDAGTIVGRIVYDQATQHKLLRESLELDLKPILGSSLREEFIKAIDETSKPTFGLTAAEAKQLAETTSPIFSQRIHDFISEPLRKAQIRLLPMQAFMKFPRFQEEREWRLVVVRPAGSTGSVVFSTVRGVLVPRFEVELGNKDSLPISRIVVGPTLHPDTAISSIRRLLASLGLDRVEVQVSPIPLRG